MYNVFGGRFLPGVAAICLAVCAGVGAGGVAHAQLFVSDFSAVGGISEYTFNGTFVRTFVAGGSGGLSSPSAIAFGLDGNMYVASSGTGSVKKYNGSTGAYVSDVVTGISVDYGLRFGADGSLYVSSYTNNAIVKVNPATGTILQTYNNGLTRPEDVFALPNGDVIAPSGTGANPVLIDHTTGNASTFATGVGVSVGLTQGADGRFYFSDFSGGTVKVVPTAGGAATAFSIGGSLNHPQYLAFGNNSLYVASFSNNTTQYFNATTGAFQGSFASNGAAGIAIRGAASAPEPTAFAFAALALPSLIGVAIRRRRFLV